MTKRIITVDEFKQRLIEHADQEPVIGSATAVAKQLDVSTKYISRYLAVVTPDVKALGYIIGQTGGGGQRRFIIARKETRLDEVYNIQPCKFTPKQKEIDARLAKEFVTQLDEVAK